MRRVTQWGTKRGGGSIPVVLAAVLAVLAVAPSVEARPRARVEWVRIDGPRGDDSAHVQKLLKRALGAAAKRANFGKARTVALSARVVELRVEDHGDVVRITCTVMGRVVGGAGARSRISYGGSPDKREELEKEVLTQVANGLVARLAQIVRTTESKVD